MVDVNVALLKRLCETPGIPGREDAVRAVVVDALRPLVDEIRADALGNVIATKRGNGGPRVMIAAHMDEIGFLVRHIDDQGFLRVQPVGGFDARVLVAQRVMVHGRDGATYRGVLQPAAKPIHLIDPSDVKPPKIEELFIDLGMTGEQVKGAIEVGDMVTLDRTLEEAGETVISKAIDDRAGLFIMIEAIRSLGSHAAEIVAVATTQEEVGLRGAQTAAYAIEPDIAIALDSTLALDIPGGQADQTVTHLGKGVALKVFDSSHLTHPKLLRHVRDLADEAGIPYQLEVLPRGGTDAGAMQRARQGASAITLSLPTRYVHTVNEMASKADLDAAIRLLALYLEAAGTRSYDYDISALA